MKKKILGVLCTCSMLVCMFFGFSGTLHAASASVYASAGTIYVGESVTFTVSVSGAAGYLSVTGAASDYDWFENSSKSYTVTASSVGTLTVSISGVVGDFSTEEDVNVTDTVSVNVIKRPDNSGGGDSNSGGNGGGSSNNNSGGGSSNQGGSSNGGSSSNNQTSPSNNENPDEEKSNDATLSELHVSEGTLNPEFSADTLNYSVVLEKGIESITIDAKATDEKASITGTGEHALEAGDNNIEVVVTAEDGTMKTYEIKVSVDETPEIFVEYNGQKLGVVKTMKDVSIPESFEEKKVELDGKEITAYHSNLKELTIIYMINEKDEKNWYLYDEGTKTITSIYKPIALLGRDVAIIDIPEELQKRAGMIYGEVEVDKIKLQGWSFEDPAFANYVVVYLMDDQGKAHDYIYEKSENTLQLYSGQAAISQQAYEDSQDVLRMRMILLIALAITNVVTIILLIVALKKKKGTNNHHKAEQVKQSDETILPFDTWKQEEDTSQEEEEEQELPLPKPPFYDENE